jgi:hypothetical protein
VRGRSFAGCGIRGRELRGPAHGVCERLGVERVDEDSRLGRHELGRASDSGGDDRAARRHAFEERLAERLDQGRLAEHRGLGDVARDLVVRNAAGDLDAGAPLELAAQRAVADEDETPGSELRERIREADDVLALDEAPDAHEDGPVAAPSGV